MASENEIALLSSQLKRKTNTKPSVILSPEDSLWPFEKNTMASENRNRSAQLKRKTYIKPSVKYPD
jgi:hypothetical protein